MNSKKSPLCSIFAHFLNKETIQIFGIDANMSRSKLTSILTEYLTVAVLLADEYCVVPPGWVDEYDVTRIVLEGRSAFLVSGLVRLPMREEHLSDFHSKRLAQYRPFQDRYPDLFREVNVEFLEGYGSALLGRESGVGARIRVEWQHQSLSSTSVAGFAAELSKAKQRAIARIANDVAAEGTAIAWPAVESRLNSLTGRAPRQFRHLLQFLNFDTYLNEYGLRIISGLPVARYNFGLASPDLRYDYRSVRAAFQAAQTWDHVRSLDAEGVILLRATKGFLDFRLAFDRVASISTSPLHIQRQFAITPRKLTRVLNETAELDRIPQRSFAAPGGLHLSSDKIQALSFRLEAAAMNASADADNIAASVVRAVGRLTPEVMEVKEVSLAKPFRVCIFVALELELRVLIRRWGLTNTYGERFWSGKLRSADVSVICPHAMGRVQAALETFEFLSREESFDLLLVLGLAGGFQQQEVSTGSIIVASSVVDMAARKIGEADRGSTPVFRPKEYGTDDRVREYLQSGSFDRSRWLASVVEDEEWPQGVRPVIHFGAIASGDEVVSSFEWISNLLRAWPTLLGVEMEAGGVCAAAERLGFRVAVARVISDFADPAKADDAWRVRGMKTLAHLLEFVDYDVLSAKSGVRPR